MAKTDGSAEGGNAFLGSRPHPCELCGEDMRNSALMWQISLPSTGLERSSICHLSPLCKDCYSKVRDRVIHLIEELRSGR